MKKVIFCLLTIVFGLTMLIGARSIVKAEDSMTKLQETNKVNCPKFIKGIDKGKSIKLSWTRVKNAKGYIIYRNGKKLKTIKKGKTLKYTDKKVKYKKIYKYYIKSYTKASEGKVKSKKSFTIRVKVCKKKYKKQNVRDITFYSLSHNPMTYGEKEDIDINVWGKYDKKPLIKKVKWYSSNESLATVDSKGVVTVNQKRKNGIVKIYAIAHNGYREYKKIKIVDMMRPTKFEKDVYISKFMDPLLKEHLKDTQDIASYFMYDKPNTKVKYELGTTVEEQLKETPKTEIDENIKKKIYMLVVNESYTIEVKGDHIVFSTNEYFTDGYIEYRVAVAFNQKRAEIFGYASSSYVQCAPRWFYDEVDH
ncbi:MAG: Ig-like domain-containing protein [Eubacterium sp.]|nr:Ig-like domain-containing protein [Eubacterium sp.]